MAVSGVPDTNSVVLFAILLSSLWQNISSKCFEHPHLIYKILMFEPIGFIAAYEIKYFTYKLAPKSILTTPLSPRP